jgi:hypothetical protein
MTKQKHKGRARASRTGKRQAAGPSSFAIPIAVTVVVLALIVGVVLSSQSRWLRAEAQPGAVAAPIATAQARATSSLPYPDVPRVTLQETVDALEQGRAVLVDVRSRSSYDKAHATGALSFPEEEIQARMHKLPADKDLVLY